MCWRPLNSSLIAPLWRPPCNSVKNKLPQNKHSAPARASLDLVSCELIHCSIKHYNGFFPRQIIEFLISYFKHRQNRYFRLLTWWTCAEVNIFLGSMLQTVHYATSTLLHKNVFPDERKNTVDIDSFYDVQLWLYGSLSTTWSRSHQD